MTMNNLLKQSLAGLRILLVLTVITGILYPLGVWVVSRVPGLRANAEGSVVEVDGRAVGSDLIGIDPVAQDPNNDPWFHTRPSATTDSAVSVGSNQGGFNEDLLAAVKERREAIAEREGVEESQVPADAVTASASGLDPQISPAYAELQVPRVARVTGLSEEEVRTLVAQNTDGRGAGFLGDPGVNVLKLNLAVQAARG
jgi:potassium-transporting ATPase KdpC subunit